jgi:hypothetical protein
MLGEVAKNASGYRTGYDRRGSATTPSPNNY